MFGSFSGIKYHIESFACKDPLDTRLNSQFLKVTETSKSLAYDKV